MNERVYELFIKIWGGLVYAVTVSCENSLVGFRIYCVDIGCWKWLFYGSGV